MANFLTPPKLSYVIKEKNNISTLNFDEERLAYIISNASCPSCYAEKKDKILLVFENIRIDSDIKISENLKLVKLTPLFIENKLSNRNDSGKMWERVYSAFETNIQFIENSDSIPALSTLLRLYQRGSIKFKTILQEANHLIRGDIFIPYKYSSSEFDYYENDLSIKGGGWTQYSIKQEDSQIFSNFISENIKPILEMPYSCRTYNMVSASPEKLRIPLLFFVIESFFSDVDSEVVFRISLYLTVILNKDEKFRKEIKSLYGVRSSIAHGDTKSAQGKITKMIKNNSNISNITVYTESILIELWKALLNMNWNPNKSGEMISELLLGGDNNSE
jgi:hypothetical protein